MVSSCSTAELNPHLILNQLRWFFFLWMCPLHAICWMHLSELCCFPQCFVSGCWMYSDAISLIPDVGNVFIYSSSSSTCLTFFKIDLLKEPTSASFIFLWCFSFFYFCFLSDQCYFYFLFTLDLICTYFPFLGWKLLLLASRLFKNDFWYKHWVQNVFPSVWHWSHPIASDHTAFPLCIQLNRILSFGLLVSPTVSHNSNTHVTNTVENDIELLMLLPLPLKWWNYKCGAPYLTLDDSCLSDFDGQYWN